MNTHDHDPIAADQDRFVHPDETRTDDEIARDEQIAARLHMSGADGADEYWADYDEYHGTVNGGETPKPKVTIEKHPGYPEGSQLFVTTERRKHQTNSATVDRLRVQGLTDDEIGAHLDAESQRIQESIDAKRKAYRESFDSDEEYYQDYYGTEDPLAGDVDRWVSPDETRDS